MIYEAIDRWSRSDLTHYGVKGMKWKSHKYTYIKGNGAGLRRDNQRTTIDTYGPGDSSHYTKVVNPRVSKKETATSARYSINQAYKPKATVKSKVQSRLLNIKSRMKTRGRKILKKLGIRK